MPDDELTTTEGEAEKTESAGAEADEAETTEESTAEKTEEAGEAGEAEASSDATDLEKKFKGDIKAADRSYWNLVKHASRVADENRILREKLAAEGKAETKKADDARREEASDAAPPEALKEIDDRIESLKTRQTNLAKEYNGRLLELDASGKAIAKLEQKLEDAVEPDKPAVEARLEAAKAKHDGIIGSLHGLKDRLEELLDRREALSKEREWVKRTVEAQQRQDGDLAAQRAEIMREFPGEVDDIFDEVCIELAVDTKDEDFRQDLLEIVNEDLMAKLWAAGAQGLTLAEIDVEDLVRKKVQKVMRHRDAGRTKFADVSKEKLDLAKKTGGKVGTVGQKKTSGLDVMKIAREKLAKLGL